MFDISIDLQDKINEFSLNDSEVTSLCNYVLDRVVDEFMNKWEGLVNSELDSSRDEYKRAMYTDRPDDNTAIIGLTSRDSKLAMMIETGADAFDEKDGFSKSDKRTVKDGGGWYLTIPFRHATSEEIMNMIAPGSNVSVIDLMKSGKTLEQEDLPQPFDEIQTHKITLNTGSLISYTHKSPIHEGMHRRDISSTVKEKRGGYMTFRRVSDKSDDQSWMHPGISAHNLMDKSMDMAQIDLVVGQAVQEFIDTKFG